MPLARILIAIAFLAVLGIPFAMRPAAERENREVPALVIVTPHVMQIRREFSRGFDRWSVAKYGQHARIDWRTPGGTTEIVQQLQAQYLAVLKGGRYTLERAADGAVTEVRMEPGTIGFDIALGGGSFDHGRLKTGVAFTFPGDAKATNIPMAVPAGFPKEQIDEWFGENLVGIQPLYDPDQYWLGTALSSFGIVYNRDVLKSLGLREPRTFEDLTDPRYAGWIALADPRQSGSITTAMDAILNNYGWEKGWRILRDMSANSRYFANSAPKPPIDISAGEAAAGLAIDFYGRSQAQSVLRPGERAEDSRVGYSDPMGAVYIDPDPVTILRGGPHPDLARRFVEFCMSEEGQALWQLPALHDLAELRPGTKYERDIDEHRSAMMVIPPDYPAALDGRLMGPVEYELRRMPVRRIMYEKYFAYFIDKVNPFEIASKTTVKGWRPAIGLMMGAFAIDTADEQRAAWRTLNAARADSSFPAATLEQMEHLFYSWPVTRIGDAEVAFTPESFKALREHWKDPHALALDKIAYTSFFRGNYRRIRALAAESR